MNNVIRWDRANPLRELENIGERFNRFFDQLSSTRSNGRDNMMFADWIANVDVK
jgi:hypothetical protein